MTQDSRAFDEWYKVAILPVTEIGSLIYTKEALKWTWQASRSQVIAELESEKLVEHLTDELWDSEIAKAAIAAIINQIKEG